MAANVIAFTAMFPLVGWKYALFAVASVQSAIIFGGFFAFCTLPSLAAVRERYSIQALVIEKVTVLLCGFASIAAAAAVAEVGGFAPLHEFPEKILYLFVVSLTGLLFAEKVNRGVRDGRTRV